MTSVIFDRTGERCIIVFDIFICLLNFFYSEIKSSGAIVYPTSGKSFGKSFSVSARQKFSFESKFCLCDVAMR